MYAMTAAHKTLPLPSYVRVKNLRNGREAIVKVNDRGPFKANRIIDLSYAAASKLGILPTGTAPVEIEAITPAAAKTKQLAQYYIQAGAFSTKQSAEQLKIKLNKVASFKAYLEHYRNHFIVKLGPFDDKHQADLIIAKIKSRGIKGSFSVLA